MAIMMMMARVVRAATPNWVHARVFRPPKHKQGPTSWAYRAEHEERSTLTPYNRMQESPNSIGILGCKPTPTLEVGQETRSDDHGN